MRFLVDNAISPLVAAALCKLGHDAVHVRDLGLAKADDDLVFDRAANDMRVLLSADTDFGTLLATRAASKPSVILFRHGAEHRPTLQIVLLRDNLHALVESLDAGAIVTIEPTRLRIRLLPLP